MTSTAIVLAGGLGTRLRQTLPDIPKPMAPVRGRPFLEYLIKYLSASGIKNLILSVGYKKEVIRNYFGSGKHGCWIGYAEESIPLGTGGAMKHALLRAEEDCCLVFNGDTWFSMDVHEFIRQSQGKDFTLALRYESCTERFGTVEIEKDGRVRGFTEKKPSGSGGGWINAGCYLVKKDFFFRECPETEVFSVERDMLPALATKGLLYGVPMEGRFIDIGIPKDYERAAEIIPPLED